MKELQWDQRTTIGKNALKNDFSKPVSRAVVLQPSQKLTAVVVESKNTTNIKCHFEEPWCMSGKELGTLSLQWISIVFVNPLCIPPYSDYSANFDLVYLPFQLSVAVIQLELTPLYLNKVYPLGLQN